MVDTRTCRRYTATWANVPNIAAPSFTHGELHQCDGSMADNSNPLDVTKYMVELSTVKRVRERDPESFNRTYSLTTTFIN